jgi:outer membrane protein insertion porin family
MLLPLLLLLLLLLRLSACSGYGYGAGIRVDSPLGPIRLEYGWNQQRRGRLHVALGYD